MRNIFGTIALILTLAAVLPATNCPAVSIPPDLPQTPITPPTGEKQKYPKIVLYSVSWCPHCKEAKEYFTKNNIPFINRDVELDDAAMTDLTKKYKSQGVPVVVIGDDKVIIRGFSVEGFQRGLKDAQQKK
jgi:glutaredoxin 3